jgi:LysM repeat protein/uncharacterized protein YvpB
VTVTIDLRTLSSIGPGRSNDVAQAIGDTPGESMKSDPTASRPVAAPQDLMALYANRLGGADWRRTRSVAPARTAPIPFGRAVYQELPPTVSAVAATEERELVREHRQVVGRRERARFRLRLPVRGLAPMAGLRRLVTAAFVVTLLFSGLGQGADAQQRYQVQDGDTLESVAAEFGVDPAAILASSWLVDPPNLQPGEVIVIPDPGQSPSEAAAEAAAQEGTSPWTVGAYYVESGDTIESIAAYFGVDVADLASLNGLDNPDLLLVGQRLLVPGEPGLAGTSGTAPGLPSDSPHPWVPTHRQERNLSCEYAAAFIATSAFGEGIPEWVFIEQVPQAKNPHYGYRGKIDGRWGGYDDYGIYPEPLVPVLNDYGFVGEVFYGESDPTLLKNHLDAGHPVIVWLAMWGDTGVRYHDEDTYTIFAGEHVMTAYAYDDRGVYLSDPAYGTYKLMSWDTFIWMWGTSDGMSLAVYPM